jgi:hypothetical protein
MTTTVLRRIQAVLAVGAFVVVAQAAGCGGSDTGNKNGSSGNNTTSGQTCNEEHSCGGCGCTCSSGPNKDKSCCNNGDSTCGCTDSNRCDQFCHYCM